MLTLLLELPGRTIYHVAGEGPAVYYLVDKEVQGVLINTPAFDTALLEKLKALAPLKFIYYPSRRGAIDLAAWRDASGAETLAFEGEAPHIQGEIDLKLDRKSKLTRTIDFLPMAGVTEGSCAMRLRNKPGVIFFGPILSPGEDGWPALLFDDSDFSYESRLFGALGLQDLTYEYAFTDGFEVGVTEFGPGADGRVAGQIQKVLDE